MFWSPAVITLSVILRCASVGAVESANPTATAVPSSKSRFIDCLPSSMQRRLTRGVGLGIEMQRGERQLDADRLAHDMAALVVDQELVRADLDGVAVIAAWIGGLDDLAAQHEAAVRLRIR